MTLTQPPGHAAPRPARSATSRCSRPTAPVTVQFAAKIESPQKMPSLTRMIRRRPKGAAPKALPPVRPARRRSLPAATLSAWISPTHASPMHCSTASSGPPKIRRSIRTTTPAGRSARSSASIARASSIRDPQSADASWCRIPMWSPSRRPAPLLSPATPSSSRTTPTLHSSRCATSFLTPPSLRQMPR